MSGVVIPLISSLPSYHAKYISFFSFKHITYLSSIFPNHSVNISHPSLVTKINIYHPYLLTTIDTSHTSMNFLKYLLSHSSASTFLHQLLFTLSLVSSIFFWTYHLSFKNYLYVNLRKLKWLCVFLIFLKIILLNCHCFFSGYFIRVTSSPTNKNLIFFALVW